MPVNYSWRVFLHVRTVQDDHCEDIVGALACRALCRLCHGRGSLVPGAYTRRADQAACADDAVEWQQQEDGLDILEGISRTIRSRRRTTAFYGLHGASGAESASDGDAVSHF